MEAVITIALLIGKLILAVVLSWPLAFLALLPAAVLSDLARKLLPAGWERNHEILSALLLPLAGFVVLLGMLAGVELLVNIIVAEVIELPSVARLLGCMPLGFLAIALGGSPLLRRRRTYQRLEEPFKLSDRSIDSFHTRVAKDRVTVGADLYHDRRLENDVFGGRRVLHSSPSGLTSIELIVRNDCERPIEIRSKDLVLSYGSVPFEVIGWEEAQLRLKSFETLLHGSGYLELVLFAPLLVMDAREVYAERKNLEATLKYNEFHYSEIAPSSTRHGFVYMRTPSMLTSEGVFELPDKRRIPREAYERLSGWDLQVTVHHSSGEQSLFSLGFGA